ncbi:MAG: hypothetical protein RL518_2566 [Pseudomonadota bacterium]
MKLAIFSPYGSFHRESGLMYLVANYLDKQGGDVVQVRCDGALPACGRDRKHQSGRTPFACLACMGEQKALAQWASIKGRDLSSYIVPDDALKSAQWISSIGKADLYRIEFRGVRLWDVCEKEFQTRWNIESLEKISSAQERDLRALYVSYVHTVVSTERFLTSWKPSLNFVVGSSDPLAQAYLSQVRRAEKDAAIFTYDAAEESIVVQSLRSGERYTTTLIIPEATELRADPRTWAPELTAIVNEMLSFLGHGADLVPAK